MISCVSWAAPLRGMITPKTNAPKMKWMPISSVTHALARMPTRTSGQHVRA